MRVERRGIDAERGEIFDHRFGAPLRQAEIVFFRALLEDLGQNFPYGAVTRSGLPFQTVLVSITQATGLIRVRSPLLTESR